MIDFKGKQRCDECLARISSLGVAFSMVDNELQCSDPTLAQSIIDAYTLDEARAWKSAQVALRAKELRDKAIALYSPAEMASWPIKLAEASAFAASGDPASAPMLAAEAAVRGITLETMMSKVSGNASSFASLEAQIAGIDGKHRDAIKALNDFDAIAGYDFSAGWPEV